MSSYKAADLQAAQKTIHYKYDKQGNLLSDGSNTYSYDGFSRLSRAEMSNGKVQVNRYDAEGLRHEMEENGELVKFLFSGDKVVAEKEGNGNVIRYVRGLGIISSDSESARTYYHYVSDEQGSITHVLRGEEKEEAEEIDRAAFVGVEEAGSEVLNYYEYDAFGNATVVQETVRNRFRYDGEQYDAVMGQYYLRARYYNPVIGRFTQEDTYYGDGLNLYAYCGNNPVGYEDPSGHQVCPTQYSVYKKYREQGMSKKEAYEAMKKELGIKRKSGYKDSGTSPDFGKSSGNNRGPYSNLQDSKSVGAGKKFTKSQKEKIIQQNIKNNGGVIKSDKSGKILVPATQSKKGVTPNPLEAQVDHIKPRSKGGSNSYSNAQVLSRIENIKKSDK